MMAAGIRGYHIFILTDADDQWAALACNNERVGLVLADDRDAVRAFHLVQVPPGRPSASSEP